METRKLPILLMLLLIALFALEGVRSYSLRIDCGAPSAYDDAHGGYWVTDTNYVRGGQNRQVPAGNFNSQITQLNSLRVFTELKKSCYSIPAFPSTTYLIRAGFYYGNYDGLSVPPTFNLEIDWNEWATVKTSSVENLELIYRTRKHRVYACLTRTQDNQFPFISMLELFHLGDHVYEGLSRDVSWLTTYRYNYGAAPDDWILGDPDDYYNRIWTPTTPSGLDPVTSDVGHLISSDNFPPDSMVVHLAQAQDVSDKIELQFPLAGADNANYVVIYLTELSDKNNGKRSIDVYVNDKFVDTVIPRDSVCSWVWANTQSKDALYVQLSADLMNATLPPLISGIEVYTASAAPVTSGTSLDDVQGLEVLTSTFHQLRAWSGDPCLPIDTKWNWINCTGSDPARVITIELEGYGLDGPLPDFSQMDALRTIDLGNNSIDGPIPNFLGAFPNLTSLDLHDNNFSGEIPYIILQRTNLNFNVKGNPNLTHNVNLWLSWKIWIAIVLAIAVSIIIVIKCRK